MHWIEYSTFDGSLDAHSKTFWDSGFRGKAMTSSFGIRNSSFGMNATPTREAVESKCATTVGNIGLSTGRMKNIEILLLRTSPPNSSKPPPAKSPPPDTHQ